MALTLRERRMMALQQRSCTSWLTTTTETLFRIQVCQGRRWAFVVPKKSMVFRTVLGTIFRGTGEWRSDVVVYILVRKLQHGGLVAP